eukprot:358364-Chlamydomonas_euryale.AAC.9
MEMCNGVWLRWTRQVSCLADGLASAPPCECFLAAADFCGGLMRGCPLRLPTMRFTACRAFHRMPCITRLLVPAALVPSQRPHGHQPHQRLHSRKGGTSLMRVRWHGGGSEPLGLPPCCCAWRQISLADAQGCPLPHAHTATNPAGALPDTRTCTTPASAVL